MAYFKIVRKTLEINGSSRSTSIDLRAEVFSYDKNVSKFLFELTSKEAEIDLTGATVRVLLTYVGNDGKKGIIEDNGGVEAYTMNQIYYLLPEELRGYDGTVVMGLYVDLPSGEAIDIQNVQFRMFKSSIDDGAGVAGVVYFKSFEEWLFQVKEKALLEIQNIDDESERITEYADTKIKEYDDKFVQSNQKMSELQQSQIELSDQLNETNKKIDEADVYRKDEVFNKPESSANVIYQLVGKEKVRMTFTADFSNKESGSDDKNPHWASAVHGLNELPSPSDFKTELVQLRYDSLKILDGQKTTVNTVAGTANQYPCLEHKWDIVEIIKRELSEDFFVDRGAIDKASQATVAKKIIVSPLESSAWGFGTCPSGNSLKIANHINGVGWQTDQLPPNTTNLVKQITARNTATPSIDDEGFLRTIIYTEASSKTVQSQINVDYGNLVFSIEISMNEHIKSMMAANHIENLATEEEAETGEDNKKIMTPLRVMQSIKKFVENKFVSIAGNETIGGLKNFKDGLLVNDVSVLTARTASQRFDSSTSDEIQAGSIKFDRVGPYVFVDLNFQVRADRDITQDQNIFYGLKNELMCDTEYMDSITSYSGTTALINVLQTKMTARTTLVKSTWYVGKTFYKAKN